MQEPFFDLALALLALSALALVSFAALKGWREWIAFKHAELESAARHRPEGSSSAVSRIEVADLKERVRRLEAIASGVDL